MHTLDENNFWLTKPRMMGLRGWSLFIPAAASSLGFFCFAVVGFGFTELAALGDIRRILVLVGAFALAFGSEIGTLSSVTEIYRKGERLSTWDIVALLISVLSTIGAFILSFATLLGVQATWGATVQMYGPIVLGLLAALDSYGGFMEFGLYLNSYDKRLEKWQNRFDTERRKVQERELDYQRQLTEHQLQQQLENRPKPSKIGDFEHPTSVAPRATASPIPAPAVVVATRPVSNSAGDNAALTQAKLAAKDHRVQELLTIYRDDPRASVSRVARDIGVHRATVYNYLNELEADGTIHRNGNGVEILTA